MEHKQGCGVCDTIKKEYAVANSSMKNRAEQSFAEGTAFYHGDKKIRTFATGATRDKDEHKYDYEGFLSPLVIRRYGEYMHKHRLQPDGKLRDSDNWQKGMTFTAYAKSLWRHFFDVWTIHRGYEARDFTGAVVNLEDALCGILFNTMGFMHELLKLKAAKHEEPRTLEDYAQSIPLETFEDKPYDTTNAEAYDLIKDTVLKFGLDPNVLMISREFYNYQIKIKNEV